MTFWNIWWLALAIKVALLPLLPITPDEAYYFAWARHLSLSYFDHPPFISWIMWLGLPLWKTALSIRFPGVLMSHAAALPWLYILQRLKFSSKAINFWLVSLLLGPLTGLGGFIVTPDVPFLFFWGATLASLLWTFEKPTNRRWLLTGGFFGLGMLSKYIMILFVPAFILWLWWEKKLSLLKTKGPWLSALAGTVLFTPVMIWNFQNHFASFAFQTQHGLGGHKINLNYPLEYLGAEIGLLNPFLVIAAGFFFNRYRPKNKFLLCFGLLPFAFFFISAFRARVEANWPLCGYPAVMALFAMMVDKKDFFKKWKPFLYGALVVSATAIAFVLTHAAHPWLPISNERDHSTITREWRVDVDALEPYQPLFARSYQMAAFHSYYRPAGREVFKLHGLDRPDFYDFQPESKPTGPSYLILRNDEELPPLLNQLYEIKNPKVLPSHLVLYELTLKK